MYILFSDLDFENHPTCQGQVIARQIFPNNRAVSVVGWLTDMGMRYSVWPARSVDGNTIILDPAGAQAPLTIEGAASFIEIIQQRAPIGVTH